jgi:hypothetical protein
MRHTSPMRVTATTDGVLPAASINTIAPVVPLLNTVVSTWPPNDWSTGTNPPTATTPREPSTCTHVALPPSEMYDENTTGTSLGPVAPFSRECPRRTSVVATTPTKTSAVSAMVGRRRCWSVDSRHCMGFGSPCSGPLNFWARDRKVGHAAARKGGWGVPHLACPRGLTARTSHLQIVALLTWQATHSPKEGSA